MSELQSVSSETISQSDLLMMALKIPVKNDHPDILEKEWKDVDLAIDNAITSLDEFRVNEGVVLQSDLEKNLLSIESELSSIEPFEEERITNIKNKLIRGLGEVQLDKNRFEQELIYYLEKLDINEEKIQQEIDNVNKNLSKIEKIKKFFIVKDQFTIENNLMTPTLKLKRYKIIKK